MASFCCVLFSFNRAMLLDMTLRSLERRMLHRDVDYTVIYHCSGEHRSSYEFLMSEWRPKGIRFVLRDERPRGFWELRRMLSRPTNLYRYLRRPKMRRMVDNFKQLVEQAISDSGAPYTFFSTDDQYLFADTLIPECVLQAIRDDPRNCSFRMGLCDHFSGRDRLPPGMDVKRSNYSESGVHGTILSWDAGAPEANKTWEYSFNVDYQVYDSAMLLEFLKPILYHMPTTLEAFGVKESRSRNYFRKLMGTAERTMLGVQANNVQTMVNNPAMNYSPSNLCQLYGLGYRLIVKDCQIPENDVLFMPEQLFFRHVAEPDGDLLEYADLVKDLDPSDRHR
jgi:hypothetical protein